MGHVYALAIRDPKEGLLAMAGHGAMTSFGEILLVDPKSGRLVRALEGHRQTVSSLALSADGEWLVSADLSGQTILWKRGEWKPETLYQPDKQAYGTEKARLIAGGMAWSGGGSERRLAVIAGNKYVILPVYVGQDPGGYLGWRLRYINLANRKDQGDYEARQWGMVTALAASADGTRVASADWQGTQWIGEGSLYFWDLRGAKVQVERRDLNRKAHCLSFSPDGRTLVAGTGGTRPLGPWSASRPKGEAGSELLGELQVWDTETFKCIRRRACPEGVQACAVSPDGKQVAYSGGRAGEVFCGPLEGSREPRVLHGRGRQVHKVAFAAKEPFYRVAFGTEFRYRGFGDSADLQESFDPQRLAVSRGPLDRDEWLSHDHAAGGWAYKLTPDLQLQLSLNGQPKGRVAPETVLSEGHQRCYCWVPDKDGNPFAIAVGTEVQNSIYVCQLADEGKCPILRHFRGHEDYVTSVGVSADRKYLVSGSADGTIALWSLADLEQGATPYGSWGADFVPVGATVALSPRGGSTTATPTGSGTTDAKSVPQPGQLVVKRVHPAGPLFHKGVREGDTLLEIRWFEAAGGGAAASVQGGVLRKETQPAAILAALRSSRGGPR